MQKKKKKQSVGSCHILGMANFMALSFSLYHPVKEQQCEFLLNLLFLILNRILLLKKLVAILPSSVLLQCSQTK